MAGPSVVVRILGDLSGLGKAFEQAGTSAQSAAGKASSSFKTMLGAVNQTGVLAPFAAAIGGVEAALDSVAGKAKSVQTVMLGVGAGVTAVGVAFSLVASKEQESHQQLQASIQATG